MRGFVLNQKFSVYLLSPSNHFDLTFVYKKIKANKMLCLVLNRKSLIFYSRTNHTRNVVWHLRKPKQN